uniref:THD domain-containing protein n=1 Tax=Electrophorus electricus TaxID=8005 RepID=A0A4W4FFH8_ELEEL
EIVLSHNVPEKVKFLPLLFFLLVFLKPFWTVFACKHPPSAHDTLLMWEQNKLFGFRLSSDSATLIVPSAGMYRIALQVTYRGTDQVSSSKQMILEHHLAVLSDSYQQDRTMLSAFETVYSENTNWRKSLYSEGIFNFQKGDGLKVKTSNLRLVDFSEMFLTVTVKILKP